MMHPPVIIKRGSWKSPANVEVYRWEKHRSMTDIPVPRLSQRPSKRTARATNRKDLIFLRLKRVALWMTIEDWDLVGILIWIYICIVLYCIVLYYIILYYIILYYIIYIWIYRHTSILQFHPSFHALYFFFLFLFLILDTWKNMRRTITKIGVAAPTLW